MEAEVEKRTIKICGVCDRRLFNCRNDLTHKFEIGSIIDCNKGKHCCVSCVDLAK